MLSVYRYKRSLQTTLRFRSFSWTNDISFSKSIIFTIDSRKVTNLKFWLSFLEKKARIKDRNSFCSIVDPYETTLEVENLVARNQLLKPSELPFDSKKAILANPKNFPIRCIIKIEGGICSRERRASQEWETAAHALRGGRLERKAKRDFMGYIHGGTGGWPGYVTMSIWRRA